MKETAPQQTTLPTPRTAPEKLLAAAEGIVLREGGHAVTIRGIARASGLNSALVSYHFGGVDALLARLVELNVDAVCDAREICVREALAVRTNASRLEALVRAYLDPLWRTRAIWHPGAARTVIRGLMPLVDPTLRRRAVERINLSVEQSQEPLLELLPHLDRDTLQLRLQLLAGAADELRLRAHEMGLFPLQGATPAGHDEPLRDELMVLALTSLRAKPSPVST